MKNILRYQEKFNSTFKDVDLHVNKICDIIEKQEIPITKQRIFIIDFTMRELLNNAVEHGNGMDFEKQVSYIIEYSKDMFEIKVFDEGKGFELPKIITNSSMVRGRGLFAISAMGVNLNVENGYVLGGINFLYTKVIDERVMELINIEFKENTTAICHINTNLVASNIKELVQHIKTTLENRDDYTNVEIDLSKTKRIDSTGITFIIGIHKVLVARHKKISITGASDEIVMLFKIMKLEDIFEIK